MRWKKPLGLFVALVLVFSVFAVVRAATISDVTWENAITDPGIELIPGYPATVNVTILTSSGEPFALANIQGADSISVTGKFIDEYGNALDMNGDGNADIYTFSNTSTPGLWTATINVSNVQPGAYTLRVEAVASNSTSGAVIDNATLELQVWVAGGPYWVAIADIKDGETITIGTTSFTIRGLSDLGAILDLGNLSTQTLTDDDRDGIFGWQHDVTGDGTNDWILFVKSSDENENSVYTLMIYSQDSSLLNNANLSDTFYRVKGDRIKFPNKIFKDHSRYNAYIVWDERWPAKLGLKAVDYYIIPLRGSSHWREGFGNVERTDIKVIKRTTYLWGLFGNEEEVYSGNVFGKNVNIDNILSIFGKFVGNAAYFGNGVWEILRGLGDITIPNDYTLRSRELQNLAVDDELWRGFNPLKTDKKGFFSRSIDWEDLLGIMTEDSES